MEKLSLAQLDKRMEELPMLPCVVASLLALNPEDDYYFEEVLSLAEEDPGFALHLIKLSNSASWASVEPIVSLREAVVRIGTRSIASLITSMAVIRVFAPTTEQEKHLWGHAIQVAIGARVIACTTSIVNINSEQAYLCGLLHDIGRFMLFQQAKELMNEAQEEHWQAPQLLTKIEQEVYGFDHAQLGARICRKWELPEILCQVVEYHHDYDLPKEISVQPKPYGLIKTIQQADLLSHFMNLNPDLVKQDSEDFSVSLNEGCVQVCTPAPLNAKQLHILTHPIWLECKGIIRGMGLG